MKLKDIIGSMASKFAALALALTCASGAWATTVTTEAELRTAIASGGAVTLGGNIALTEEIAVGTTVTLDLGTYTISSPTNVFRVAANGNFTVNADATNPGGISVPTNRCCVYASYGWDPGAKTVVLNGGVFTGNCVFNWSETASENIEELYDFMPDGYGSGEKAVPTSVTINGGTFTGGYEDGNVGEYRCYYFTVNGGTFEKGLDCADTRYGSFGVTSTCKAFFKGGKYRTRYPAARTQDPGKVFIGTETADYVYYIDGDYYVIAPDYSACEATACYDGACVEEVSWFIWLVSRCHQRWTTTAPSYRWYFLTYAQAASWGTDPQYVNAASGGDSAASAPALRSSVRRLSAAPRTRLLSSDAGYAADNATPTSTVDCFAGQDGYATVTFGGIAGTKLENFLTNPDRNSSSDPHEFFQDRTDLDACRVLTITQPASGGSIRNLPTLKAIMVNESDEKSITGDEVQYLVACANLWVKAGRPNVKSFIKRGLNALAELDDNSPYFKNGMSIENGMSNSVSGDLEYVSFAIQYFIDNSAYQAVGSVAGDLFAGWTTDIIVSFDKDVAANTVELFVGGDSLGSSTKNPERALKVTIAGESGAALSAGDAYVLAQSGDYDVKTWASFHSPLLLAVKNTSAANAGTTATVALRHHKDGETDVIRAFFTCTFSAASVVNQISNMMFDDDIWTNLTPASNGELREEVYATKTYTDENGETLAYTTVKDFVGDRLTQGIANNAAVASGSDIETGLGSVALAEESAADTTVKKYISVLVNGLQVVGATSASPSLGAISYSVAPKSRSITTGETMSDTTRAITNAEIGGKTITFRLPLTDDFTARALVVHTSDDANYPEERWIDNVAGSAGAHYVEISTTHFSEFVVSPIGADDIVYVTSASGAFIGGYTTLADAYAATEDGGTIYLLQNVSGNIEVASAKTFNINANGYTYSGAVTAAEGFGIVESTSGVSTTYTVFVAVAQIGETKYPSLAAAIAAAQDGDTVTLLADYTAPAELLVSKSLTLDLGGNTLGCSALRDNETTPRTLTADAGTVVVRNGTIEGRVNVYDSVAFTLAQNATVDGYVVVWGDGTYGQDGCKTPTLNVYGTITNTDDAAISCNGTDLSGAVINIYNDAVVTSTDDVAIFLPSGNLTVSGGTITGATGIYAKSGSVTVTGGTITGNGAAADYVYRGDGATATGEALVIDNCGYPGGVPAVSITGGTFTSENAYPVGSYTKDDSFNTVIEFISGGTFSDEVLLSYCANGYMPKDNGNDTYGVAEGTPVVQNFNTGVYYSTLASAVSEASEGDTITVLVDEIELTSTIEIDKNLTIDLGNSCNIIAKDCRAFWVKAGHFTLTGVGVIRLDQLLDENDEPLPMTLADSSSVIRVGSNDAVTSFTLGDSVYVTTDYCYGITYFGTKKQTVVIDGKVEVTGNQAALSGNGSAAYNTADGGSDVTVNGSVSSRETYAIYSPETGTLTINGEVEGMGGVEVKAGTVVIGEKATIASLAEEEDIDHTASNNGTSTTGYAIAAIGNANYVGAPTVTIEEGATIDGFTIALAEANAPAIGTVTAKSNALQIPADYKWVATEPSGGYTLAPKTYVAQIGSNKYETLADAIADAQNGDTVKLLADIAMDGPLNVSGKTVTIDLDGNQVSLKTGVTNIIDADVTIVNGTINIDDVSVGANNAIIEIKHGKSLTLDGVTLEGEAYSAAYGVFYARQNATLNVTNCTFTLENDLAHATGGVFKGDYTDSSLFNITDSTLNFTDAVRGFAVCKAVITGSNVSIVGSGNGTGLLDNAINRVNLTLDKSNVTISGGTGRGLTLRDGCSTVVSNGSTLNISGMGEGDIQFQSDDTLTVSGNSTVSAGTVVLKSSTTETVDNLILVDATSFSPVYEAQIGRTLYKTLAEALDAAVDGTEVIVVRDISLNADIEAIPAADANVTLTQGDYTITANGHAIILSGSPLFVVTTDKQTDAFDAASGYTLVKSGSYVYTPTKIVAMIGETPYTTLADAIDAAQDGQTVKLLSDCSGAGIVVPQGKFGTSGLTVDFGGFTYKVNSDPLAGSTGTQTQAFQLLKDNTITFKNGAIVADNVNVKMLIQNYSNLTLDGMTLDATKGSNAVGYVLSTNNGSTTIKDTTITAKTGGVAFDACTGWGSYTSNSVTVTGASKITGDIEASFYGTGTGPVLTLSSGTHDGAIKVAQGFDDCTVNKSEAFVQSAPDGYKWVATEAEGEYKLVPKTYVAQIVRDDEVVGKYETLQEAIAAAVDGETVTLLKNCSGSGIVVPQGKFGTSGLTVDFGGFTYTVDSDPLAGSTGTQTQAFQLLKDNTITFKNGAIVADNAGVKMLVQNYSNLTLDNMTLDAMQGSNAVGYVLSTNNGSTTIKDTTITAKTGGVAFDACSGWGGYASNSVTVTGATSAISGDIEVSYYGQANTAPAVLTLTSGTHTGAIKVAQGFDDCTVNKSADFVQTAPEGYEWVASGTEGIQTLDKILAIVDAATGTVEMSKKLDGYTFKIAVAQNGGEAAEMSVDKPEIPSGSLPASGEYATYAFTAVRDSDGSETAVQNTVGILHVANAACGKTTIIGVPWFALGEKITADSLVYLGNRSAGDKLMAYDEAKNCYWTWELKSKSGESGLAWTKATTIKDNEPVEGQPEASEFVLKRGQGLFLTRENTEDAPIYLVGRADGTGTTTTTLAAAESSEKKPTWTLVAAPSTTPLDLNAKTPVFGSNFSDQEVPDAIVLPTGGAGIKVPYTYKEGENGGWGRPVSKMFGNFFITVWSNENATIPAGVGFWYLNNGDDPKSVEW